MEYKKVVKEYVIDVLKGAIVTDGLPVKWTCSGYFDDDENEENPYSLTFSQPDFRDPNKFYIEVEAIYVDVFPEFETAKSGPGHFKDCVVSQSLKTANRYEMATFKTQKIKKWHFTDRVKILFTAYVPLKKNRPVIAGYDLSEKNADNDQILVVSGKKFHVNKAVLSAYSPFFNNLSNNERFEEAKKDEIELNK